MWLNGAQKCQVRVSILNTQFNCRLLVIQKYEEFLSSSKTYAKAITEKDKIIENLTERLNNITKHSKLYLIKYFLIVSVIRLENTMFLKFLRSDLFSN